MRNIGAFLSTLALIVLMGASCSAGSMTATDSKLPLATYENKQNYFQIEYPKDWEKQEGVYGTVAAFISPQSIDDEFPENVTIVVKATDATVTDFVASAVNNAPQSYKDFTLIDDKPTTLDGAEAEMITYTFTQDELKIYTREVFAVKNGRLYDITFTASQSEPEANWDIAQKMIASFKIIE